MSEESFGLTTSHLNLALHLLTLKQMTNNLIKTMKKQCEFVWWGERGWVMTQLSLNLVNYSLYMHAAP